MYWQDNKAYIDKEIGLINCGGMESLFAEIVVIFISQREEKIKSLNDFIEAEKWDNYEVIIHALKTNCRTIGAMALGELAYELELISKKLMDGQDIVQNKKIIKEKHGLFADIYEKTAKELEQMI